jgi:hypothetical protein
MAPTTRSVVLWWRGSPGIPYSRGFGLMLGEPHFSHGPGSLRRASERKLRTCMRSYVTSTIHAGGNARATLTAGVGVAHSAGPSSGGSRPGTSGSITRTPRSRTGSAVSQKAPSQSGSAARTEGRATTAEFQGPRVVGNDAAEAARPSPDGGNGQDVLRRACQHEMKGTAFIGAGLWIAPASVAMTMRLRAAQTGLRESVATSSA